MNNSVESGLELRLLRVPGDIEKLADFVATVHDAGVGALTRELALRHPDANRMRWLAMAEKATGDIVSTLCLLPWTIRYGDVEIPAAEMGIVATRKDWRKRGLVRTMADRFDRLLAEEGYLLSHIQGIPYFYRQFGYEYAIPLETQNYLEFRQVDDMQGEKKGPESGGVTLRLADRKDLSALVAWYDEHVLSLDVSSLRSPDQWGFLLDDSLKTDYAADTYIVETAHDAVGYCRIPRQGFGDALILGECSNLPDSAYASFFARLRDIAKERAKPFIRLNLGPTHPAVIAARDAGARDAGGYGWQIRLPDPAAFLGRIAPVLDGRLAAGPFESYSGELKLNLYRTGIGVRFEKGQTVKVEGGVDVDGGNVSIPPHVLTPIVLGQKSIEECRRFYPDFSGPPRGMRLLQALFPPLSAFLHCPY